MTDKKSKSIAFTKAITAALAYWRVDVSEFTLSVWMEAFGGYEVSQITKAITLHAVDPERGMYAPKVADIVRIIKGVPTDRAQLAWGKVLGAMESVGAYTDVVFDDAVIHAVVEDLGGWPKLCRLETKDLSYTQHRFCESYKAYAAHTQKFEYPRRLSGDRSPDAEYTRKGLALPAPAVVGNTEAARTVYQAGSVSGKTAISYLPVNLLSAKPLLEVA